MAGPSEMEGLRSAWRALGGGRDRDGWQTIPVSVRGPCTLFAGRRMPGGEEAVLLGFHHLRTVPDSHQLPQGHGFEVLILPADRTGDDQLMLALARRTSGSSELFGMMAEDLLRLLDSCATEDEKGILRRFLARIRAWQDFMDRHREGVLSAGSEQGLFGELVMLGQMLDAGVRPESVLNAWQGPIDGLQDFVIGTGAIEVKTTLSCGQFPATISSLDQLDEGLSQPLFIAAVRLALDPSGMTLPVMADTIRMKLNGSPAALETFDVRLIQGGLLPTAITQYARRFLHASSAILPVRGEFPRLTRGNVHYSIRKARYEIDLDLTGASDVGLKHALELLGTV
jgi:hypothetical protein